MTSSIPRRDVSVKMLCLVSQTILTYIDKHGTCTASNDTLQRDSGAGNATVQAAVRILVDLGAFVHVMTWHPATRTVRSLSLPPEPTHADWYITAGHAFRASSYNEALTMTQLLIASKQVKIRYGSAVQVPDGNWLGCEELTTDPFDE